MRTTESRGDLSGGTSRFISIVGMLGLIVGLGALASRWAHAEIQNDLVGFSPNHVFESAEAGEHVDVMSGNLTLTIPIGPRFKLNDNFGYGLTLYYNSKIWEHECPHGYGPQTPCPGTLPPFDDYGLGFSLLPGRVYQHADDKSYVYRIQLEDGSEHFWCNSSEDVANCNGYTMDTTHVGMQSYTPTGQQGWTAWMPDGRGTPETPDMIH